MAIKINHSNLYQGMDELKTKTMVALLMGAQTEAMRLESYMKKNRPWTDRTENAKASLRVQVSQLSDTVLRMTLSHGVEYGIWLELAHGKKCAIVAPTIEKEGPKVFQRLSKFALKG